MIKKFFCQFCMKAFDSGKECAMHEQEHSSDDIQKVLDTRYCFKDDFNSIEIFDELQKLLKENPDSVICPECNGIGGYEGTDPYDWRDCYFCSGKKIVKINPKIIFTASNGKQYYFEE